MRHLTRVLRAAAFAALPLVAASGLVGLGAAGPASAAPSAPSAPFAPAAPVDAIRDGEYWLDSSGIRTAWATTRGAGVTIAVIDTGVDRTVAELRGAVTGGADFSGRGAADGSKPVGTAVNLEHGTLVASLAAGRGSGTGAGVIGAAPAASILSLSIAFGTAVVDSDQQVADAVRWAVDHGASVINMSLTRNTLDWPPSWDDAFLYAMQHDVVVVAAAGNRGTGTAEVGAPATMPGVLTVSGVDRSGAASVSASTQGITIGVAAPSEQLLGVGPGGQYYQWSGTSGATPIVAGIVALVRAAHPGLDAANVIQRVLATARDAGPPGPDPSYGYGLVDAAAAVQADVPTVTVNPTGDLAEWIRLNRRATAAPSTTAEATITAPPVAAAPIAPDAAGAIGDPTGVLLPSIVTLQIVGLPTVVGLMVVTAIGGPIVGLLRSFKRPRPRR